VRYLVAVGVRIMENVDRDAATLLGFPEELTGGYRRVAFGGYHCHIVAFGKPGRFDNGPQPFLLYQENLVITVSRPFVSTHFACAERHGAPRVRFVEDAPRFVVQARECAVFGFMCRH